MDVSSLYLGFALPPGVALQAEAASAAPEWVQLLPAGSFRGVDGRGPWRVVDANAIIKASMADGPIPIDENHAIDYARASGIASPARGWIEAMQARPDGIWGRVSWTPSGTALMSEKAYRGISPVFVYTKTGVVERILRAALTNAPNLKELATLNAQLSEAERKALPDEMFAVPAQRALPIKDADHVKLAWDMLERTADLSDAERAEARRRILARAKTLGVDTEGWNVSAHSFGAKMDITAVRQALGLPESADEAACLAAISAQRQQVALQSEQIAGLSKTTVPLDAVVALQSEIAQMREREARGVAESVIDAAIAAGKPVAPVRDQLIAQHMSDPALVVKMLDGMPSLNAARGGDGRFLAQPPSGEAAMSADDEAMCAKMNIDPEALKKWRAEQRKGAK